MPADLRTRQAATALERTHIEAARADAAALKARLAAPNLKAVAAEEQSVTAALALELTAMIERYSADNVNLAAAHDAIIAARNELIDALEEGSYHRSRARHGQQAIRLHLDQDVEVAEAVHGAESGEYAAAKEHRDEVLNAIPPMVNRLENRLGGEWVANQRAFSAARRLIV